MVDAHEFCAHDHLVEHYVHRDHHRNNRVKGVMHAQQVVTSKPIRFARELINEAGKDWTCVNNAKGLARIGNPVTNNQCLDNGPPKGDCFLQCSSSSFSNEISFIFDTLVPAALTKLDQYVRLPRPVVGDLDLGSTSNPCGYVAPSTFDAPKSVYKDTDYVLFITTRPMVNTVLNNAQDFYPDRSRDVRFNPSADPRPFATWTTYAFPCQQDATTGRPISGVINVDPAKISYDRLTTDSQAFNQTVDLVLHELVHALGFSSQYMQRWQLEGRNAQPVVWDMGLFTKLNVTTTVNKTYLATPRVKQAARDHFNCPTLRGAELEDGYVTGFDAVRELGGAQPDTLPFSSTTFDTSSTGPWLAGSHFEKRIFGPELMTAGPRPLGQTVVSQLTLAALEDTGWWQGVPGAAEPLEWGRDMGCDFLRRSCADLTCLFEQSQAYECDAHTSTYWCELDTQCSYDLKSKTRCETKLWDVKIPEKYRYFRSSPKKGGFDALGDFCPAALPLAAGGSCQHLPADGAQYIEAKRRGEVIDESSRCFRSSVDLIDPRTTIDSLKHPPACFRTHCLDKKTLKFKLGDQWYTCDRSGFRLFIGPVQTVFCPRIETLCRDATTDTQWPLITDIFPTSAIADGGAIITINGKNFRPGPGPMVNGTLLPSKYEITFAGVAASNITYVSSVRLTCTLPPITNNATIDILGPVRISYIGRDMNDQLDSAFKPTSRPVPSPSPDIGFGDEEGSCSGFLCKDGCFGAPCWLIPVIILPLILFCVCFNILRKRAKRKKMEKKGKELGDAEEPSIQL
eukprot:TRINITY_DN5767_c0_g1_i1.p1 TRINITY_DN5767_c0_g1~~TRINITY_DN5767_c0_g1_i1.p1  ORF type:complete len:821 (-),score=148.52 TRINITY_DN5767_c0_g1_i1:241-2625(-)